MGTQGWEPRGGNPGVGTQGREPRGGNPGVENPGVETQGQEPRGGHSGTGTQLGAGTQEWRPRVGSKD